MHLAKTIRHGRAPEALLPEQICNLALRRKVDQSRRGHLRIRPCQHLANIATTIPDGPRAQGAVRRGSSSAGRRSLKSEARSLERWMALENRPGLYCLSNHLNNKQPPTTQKTAASVTTRLSGAPIQTRVRYSPVVGGETRTQVVHKPAIIQKPRVFAQSNQAGPPTWGIEGCLWGTNGDKTTRVFFGAKTIDRVVKNDRLPRPSLTEMDQMSGGVVGGRKFSEQVSMSQLSKRPKRS
jgi:hypothetical protein